MRDRHRIDGQGSEGAREQIEIRTIRAPGVRLERVLVGGKKGVGEFLCACLILCP